MTQIQPQTRICLLKMDVLGVNINYFCILHPELYQILVFSQGSYMGAVGVEPTRLPALDPKSSVSAIPPRAPKRKLVEAQGLEPWTR